jgi:eukaryotic-like serine/threonine-protein kinase
LVHPAIIGKSLGKYRIDSVLGEGAMGVVYKAFDPVIERAVAIKTIRKQLIEASDAGAAMAARFRNEARAAGRLQHAGIVSIYEYGEDADTAFIAMEYVEGKSLAQHLASYAVREQTIPVREVHVLMAQLLSALHYAHEQGVWHRDVKPANLIITTEGKLKVADFGIARLEGAALTQVNAVIGTPTYMAPEQYLGELIDRRIDIFAAGVVLYQLLTNRLPFTGGQAALMYKTLNETPKPPSIVEGSTSPDYFDAIVLRALAKQAGDRFQTAKHFKLALTVAAQNKVDVNDGEATVILEAFMSDETQVGKVSLQLQAPTTTGMRSAVGDFPPALLSSIEASLSRQLGPVARLLVRRAAASAADEMSLRALLAEHFTTVQERSAFLAGSSAPPAPSSAGAFAPTALESRTSVMRAQHSAAGMQPGTQPGTSPSAARAFDTTIAERAESAGLTPELLDKITQCLARRVGPIAKVMVRKASVHVTTRDALFKSLCEHFDEGRERSAVAAELAAIK